MRLADFIDNRMPHLLVAWEAFAKAQEPASADMSSIALRDHAEQILRAIALDLRSVQTLDEQHSKSLGQMKALPGAPHTAAQTHAVLRAASGFTLQQMVAEYRALRESVVQLWLDSGPDADHLVTDLLRFNQALDQAVAESADFYTKEVDRWRHIFLGMLGHDLRNPLNVIILTSTLLAKTTDGTPANRATAQLVKSGRRMQELLDDLLDYSRTLIGLGIRVQRTANDLAVLCQEEVAAQRVAHPRVDIRYSGTGPTDGALDQVRMRQLIGNLIINAARHGNGAGGIDVNLRGGEDRLTLSVENTGTPIPPDLRTSLFDPFRRAAGQPAEAERKHLGLGLFIVRQIALSHGGDVMVDSTHERTVFTVDLPRLPNKAPTAP